MAWEREGFDLPKARGPVGSATRAQPYQYLSANGIRASITGSYSAANPFIWYNYANNTAEWKSVSPDYTAGFPPDTVVFDGRLSGPVEYNHPR